MDRQLTVRAWPRHLHALRLCCGGVRPLAEALGLDYNAFVFQGIDVAELRASGNAFAIALAEQAEREHQEQLDER
ncbi:MAG: hypothetical protein ACKVIS_14385 [Pseudomonadales bacterium]